MLNMESFSCYLAEPTNIEIKLLVNNNSFWKTEKAQTNLTIFVKINANKFPSLLNQCYNHSETDPKPKLLFLKILENLSDKKKKLLGNSQ